MDIQQGMPGQGQMVQRMMPMMSHQHPQMMGQPQHHSMMGQPQMMGHMGMGQPQMAPNQGHQMSGPPPQHIHPTPSAQELPKYDNISKAKALMPTIKECVSNVFRTGAEAVYANTLVDSGSKQVELDASRFDKAFEEFSTVCDHMEMHLKAAMECISQGEMSNESLPAPVTQTKMEGSLTYPQYVGVVKGQITFAKEVHDSLAEAAQKLLE